MNQAPEQVLESEIIECKWEMVEDIIAITGTDEGSGEHETLKGLVDSRVDGALYILYRHFSSGMKDVFAVFDKEDLDSDKDWDFLFKQLEEHGNQE